LAVVFYSSGGGAIFAKFEAFKESLPMGIGGGWFFDPVLVILIDELGIPLCGKGGVFHVADIVIKGVER
jgi:hypothetical protein